MWSWILTTTTDKIKLKQKYHELTDDLTKGVAFTYNAFPNL
jgi:hypothetical protein